MIFLHISCFRAIFSFLTSKDDHYTSVLEEDGLLLVDRLGFAVTFLDDAGLENFMEREWAGMLEAGRLEGLVLSGGEREGAELLQRFVDRTADVQTVSWMAVKVLSLELANSDQVKDKLRIPSSSFLLLTLVQHL